VAGFGAPRRAVAREIGSFCQRRLRRFAMVPIGFGFRVLEQWSHAPNARNPRQEQELTPPLAAAELGSLCKITSCPLFLFPVSRAEFV